MNKKLYYAFGSIFIIVSSFLYSFERFISYYEWIGIINSDKGMYPASPDLPGILTNIFIPIFIIIGIIFIIKGYKSNQY